MNRITTHTELEIEKKRLGILLANKKQIVMEDFEKLRTNLDPVNKIVTTVSNFTRPATSNQLFNKGINAGVSLLMRNTFLGKAGLITKLILPIIIKKFVKSKINQKKEDTKRNILHVSPN